MRKIISYCLYGSIPMYLHGAIRNAEQAPQLYPDWQTRFYVGESVPVDVCNTLRGLGAEVVPVTEQEDASAMLWRFRPAGETDVNIVISRDCDSRLSSREANAVRAWLAGNKLFHIMRDHPHHTIPILGGMWGARGESLYDLRKLLDSFQPDGLKGADQIFLAKYIYPRYKNNSCIHDSFFKYEWVGRFFPEARKDSSFVGEIVDEYDQPSEEHRIVLKRVESSLRNRLQLYFRSIRGFGDAWTSRSVL